LTRWLLVASVIVIGAACWIEKPGSPSIVNTVSTGDEVNVYEVTQDEGEELLVTIALGGSVQLDDVGECTETHLVARLPDGTEVERRPPGFCEGDVWRINGDEAD
jgi:hypothetical protein